MGSSAALPEPFLVMATTENYDVTPEIKKKGQARLKGNISAFVTPVPALLASKTGGDKS